jgi:hypothetical protein
VPLYTPSSAPPGGSLANPPPGLDPLLPPAAPVGSRNGTYSGWAEVFTTAGGLCTEGMKVIDFKVHGNAVRFGRFRGTIQPDGGLQMVSGGTWIIGQFEGPTFRGQVSSPGAFHTVGCTFILALDRTGP